jgi:hypothetical protein
VKPGRIFSVKIRQLTICGNINFSVAENIITYRHHCIILFERTLMLTFEPIVNQASCHVTHLSIFMPDDPLQTYGETCFIIVYGRIRNNVIFVTALPPSVGVAISVLQTPQHSNSPCDHPLFLLSAGVSQFLPLLPHHPHYRYIQNQNLH